MRRFSKRLWIYIAPLFLFVLLFCFYLPHFNQNYGSDSATTIQRYHVSMYYYDNPGFFQKSIQSFANVQPLNIPLHIFIVNQHILAAYLMAHQFALSADPNVKTVVLITQNNWDAGHAPIITSRYYWKTPLGNIPSDTTLTENLINKQLATEEEPVFVNEHGITGIVPYVAHAFPNAAITPLVIRDGTPDEMVDALATELSKLDPKTTAIIGTIDMSHYLPKYIADAHDRLTVQTIKEFDCATLPRLDIDTTPTLRTVMKVAQAAGQTSFVQTGGANSADIVGDPDLPSTTSYITGYFAPGVPQPIATSIIHLLFVGDLMFDRAVAEHAQKFGIDSLFTNIDRLFLGTHAVIGNLEGTITNEQSLSIENNSILRFTFNPIFAGLLKKNAFTTVSLANNHALDFGKSGYVQTEENLQAAGIVPFGSPFNNENISTKITADGKTICFIGYHDLFTSDPTSAFQEIKNIRPACSYITLFAHWGVEYVSTATDRQRMLAHQFIDAGADLVIGSHPHVVEPVEVYKNKAIFYSLGNFMFDQSFSFGTEHGLAVNVEWNGAQTQFTLVPTTLRHAEVSVADITDQAKILSALVDKNTPQDITSAIMKTKSFTLWNTSQSNQ